MLRLSFLGLIWFLVSTCSPEEPTPSKEIWLQSYSEEPYYIKVVPMDSIGGRGSLEKKWRVTPPDSVILLPHGEDVYIVIRVDNSPLYMPKRYRTGDMVIIYFWTP